MEKKRQQWNEITLTPAEVKRAFVEFLAEESTYFKNDNFSVGYKDDGSVVLLGYVGDLEG